MISEARLLQSFLDLVRIDSPSGEEAAIAQELHTRLRTLGLTVELDAMQNIVARLDGRGNPLLLAAHMDTVMPGRGIKPIIKDGVVYSDGTTILGADDKAGIAIILEVVQCIVEQHLSHPPLEVVLTVQEETGLNGAKGLDKSLLQSRNGISLDSGGPPGTIVVAAPTHNLVSATVRGKAAHAGAHPEHGINAIVVAAEAVCQMPLGRIDEETTANIGVIRGGVARNVVPDCVELSGEARSRSLAKLEAQTAKMVQALRTAAHRHGATADVEVRRAYDGYSLSESDVMVARLVQCCRANGIEPSLVPTGGGSDANIFNAHGMQVVNLSMGAYEQHSTGEHVALADMATCARIVMNCVRDAAV